MNLEKMGRCNVAAPEKSVLGFCVTFKTVGHSWKSTSRDIANKTLNCSFCFMKDIVVLVGTGENMFNASVFPDLYYIVVNVT